MYNKRRSSDIYYEVYTYVLMYLQFDMREMLKIFQI